MGKKYDKPMKKLPKDLGIADLSVMVNRDARDLILMGFKDEDFLAVINEEVPIDEMIQRVLKRDEKNNR